MYRARNYLSITRPLNSAMTGLGIVFATLLYSNWSIEPVKILVGFTTGYLGAAASMVINDVVDYRVDAVNKPWKPIPRGLVDRRKAGFLSIVFLVCAVAINAFTGILPLVAALAYGLISYLYSFMRRFWWSHFMVAFSTTAPVIYGYALAGTPEQYLVLASMFSLTVYVATLGREVVKAVMDMEGDRAYGYSTIPLRFGLKTACKTMLLTGFTAPVLAMLTGCLAKTSTAYYVLMALSSTIYAYNMVRASRNPGDKEVLEKARKQTLYAMLIGLIAFLLSKT